MKLVRARSLSAGVVTIAMTVGMLGASAGIANAAYSPTSPPYPSDPNNVSYIEVYDASTGAVVTGGSDATQLKSYFFASHGDLTPGDTKAVVSGYLAESGKQPGDFSGQTLGTATTYPVTAAGTPTSVSSKTTPVAKGGNGTFAGLAAAFPNTAASTSDFYELYQLRVQTTFPTGSSNYAYLDIKIDTTANTWTQVGPAPPAPVATAPGAPTSVTATAGDGSANVSWTAPSSTGGATISKYTITATPSTGPAVTQDVTSGTSGSISGLTNGTQYAITVTATNSAGTGAASSPAVNVTPVAAATAPGAPTGVEANASSGKADVAWTAPTSNGGSAITKYTITAKPTTGASVVVNTAADTTHGTVTLINGTTYSITVTATNAVGTSVASSPAISVTPTAAPTAPAAPTGVTATAGDTTADVSWTAPSANGSAITGYTVTAVPTTGVTVTAQVTTTSAHLTGLVDGTAYSVTVTATNAVGTSPASSPAVTVTPKAPTAPGAPTGVKATSGDSSATVSWTAPVSNGGSGITKYTVTASADDVSPVTIDSTTTSATVTGLTNGTVYSITVTATNAVGTGPASSPAVSVTPGIAKTGLSLNSSRDEITAGDQVRLAGTLIGGNNVGQTVILYGYTDDSDKATSAVKLTTSSTGAFTTVLAPTRPTDYTAVFHATSSQQQAVSPDAFVDVDYRITVIHPIANNTRTKDRTLTITGRVFPEDAGKKVALAVRTGDDGTIIAEATVGAHGNYTINVTLKKGTYLLQVGIVGGDDDQVGASRLFRVYEV